MQSSPGRSELVAMGRRFFAASELPGEFDATAFLDTVARIEADGGLFTSPKGMLGGVIAPGWCAPDWTAAVELFWWAEDGQGLRLLRRFEEWAKDRGANEIRMTTLAAMPRAEKLLRGYRRTETSWSKVIQWAS